MSPNSPYERMDTKPLCNRMCDSISVINFLPRCTYDNGRMVHWQFHVLHTVVKLTEVKETLICEREKHSNVDKSLCKLQISFLQKCNWKWVTLSQKQNVNLFLILSRSNFSKSGSQPDIRQWGKQHKVES